MGAHALDANQQRNRYQNAIVSGCAVSDGANAMEVDVAAATPSSPGRRSR
ncbi:hypothetical protein ACFQL0_13140 [Haloplanus litoreus]